MLAESQALRHKRREQIRSRSLLLSPALLTIFGFLIAPLFIVLV
jgi:hypothetical protein